MSGLMLVVVQVAAVAILAAIVGGLLGFVVGRRGRPAVPARSTAAPATIPTPAPDGSAAVRELEAELTRRRQALHELEASAVATWDRTVPSLEDTIEKLTAENRDLRDQIAVLRGDADETRSGA